jgi:hypothetical protein
VSQCNTSTLFYDLFGSDNLKRGDRDPAPTHRESELITYINSYLKANKLMNTYQLEKWREDCRKYSQTKPVGKKQWSSEEKLERNKKLAEMHFQDEKYKKIIKIATEDWKLSTDGVVHALYYNAKDKVFVAKVHYKKVDKVSKKEAVVREHINVTDWWVIDTFGKDLAKKLIDRGENKEFLKPLNEHGVLATVKVDERNICGLKYHPPKFTHKREKKTGRDLGRTEQVRVPEMWKAKLDNGKIIDVGSEVVTQFGQRFVDECKILNSRKFVSIPVGSCRSSVIKIFPALRCDDAPAVRYMQGDIDSCVFSSLASAFHHTGIPDLVKVSKFLQDKANGYSGGTDCLNAARRIVQQNVKWLQTKRLRKSFNWESDIHNHMFLVGVLKDSTGSCQHAVTIFRKWIYDSNEPFALPIRKESLDYCTWSIKDGVVEHASTFVSFVNGWIFEENEMKKKKVLDSCA